MDIVDRLRDMKMGAAVDVACALDDLCIEAAKEIERLRADHRECHQLLNATGIPSNHRTGAKLAGRIAIARDKILEEAAIAVECLFAEKQTEMEPSLYEDGFSDGCAAAASVVRVLKLKPTALKPDNH